METTHRPPAIKQTLVRTAGASAALVTRRIDVPGMILGFSPPPCPVNIKLVSSGNMWSLVALTPPGKPPVLARWLEPYKPSTVYIAPGLAPKLLRAGFDPLPEAWAHLLSSVAVRYIQLGPQGSASVFVEDTAERVQRFIASVQAGYPAVRSRKTQPRSVDSRPTPRQLEVLSLAVALGYYELPHKLNLRSLAQQLGLSVGAVSDLLRRGEALIVTSYIDSLVEAQWEGAENPAAPPQPAP